MNLVEFFSAFGLGALVVALVQSWLSHRSYLVRRNFDEKKEAYVGYLDAIFQSEKKATIEFASLVGHWQNRIELVGSKQVIFLCSRMTETNPKGSKAHPDRPKVLQSLKNAMREDLGVGGSV